MKRNGKGTAKKAGDGVIKKSKNTAATNSTDLCEDCGTADEEELEEDLGEEDLEEDLEEDEEADSSDIEEDEEDESIDDQVIGAAKSKSKPCIPPPRSPQEGSCVGVLYKSTKKNQQKTFCKQSGTAYYCVHNGRLVKIGDGYILVNHWFVNQSTGERKEETRRFWKGKSQCPQYLDIKTTPDVGCKKPKNRQPEKNRILPGECVGIEISGAKTPTGRDMKNGRYKNWVDTNGKAHCKLPIPLPKNLKYIFYFHYPKSSIDLTAKQLVPDCKPKRLSGQKILRVELHDEKPVSKPIDLC